MESYPKVWAHYHPLVDDLLTEGTIHLLEKLDGSNFRFMLYEDRFTDEYDAADFQFDGVDVGDGDIVYGSKGRVRATLDEPVENVNGNFWRAVTHLRDALDIDAIRRLHDDHGPLVFFAENIVLHSLEYDWDTIPPLIGFDVYASRRDDGTDEPFDGYLPLDEAREVFDAIGLATAPVIERDLDAETFEPEGYDIPDSQWRDGNAEGVVIRNDDVQERGKLVSEEFHEKNAERWGKHVDDADDDTERLVATYCTNARIRKNVHKLINDEGHEFSRELIEPLRKEVVYDIWEEAWPEIIHENWTIEMQRIWPLVASRCAEVVKMMETNAKLTGAPPDALWRDDG